ncbi:dentin sialophosphoprotein [Venturia canescens]|uniref:dentin sialophosphoprotein n=1 Tax=Venturia canescens TaxID=32260 RepID=UPI001C9D5001|nr:dentin sialophosphoprotein [Venturia canescens]XP_043278411.1 dentin sialophosphoprotein [Venturia canescens]XP_043278412.1 dentin sialophosphoprotein [Venturia canescens]XP_043278413.1 dentin sialophosphoprotein [Venturia canescens]XP_043278414.1 dentin sialophosphoprotein [Venturia canescens]
MRRTSPQNKLERSGTGQSGSSPRVTLRLNQVRNTKDDKKTSGAVTTSRQSASSATSQMEASNRNASGSSGSSSSTISSSVNSTTALGASTGGAAASAAVTTTCSVVAEGTCVGASSGAGAGAGTNAAGGGTGTSTGGNGNLTTNETNDVYEFKSSKEATPVRGSSCSPNPEKDHEKDKEIAAALASGNQDAGGIAICSGSGSQIEQNETMGANSANLMMANVAGVGGGSDSHVGIAGSPSAKRPHEPSDNPEEQEDEMRRKKRKDSEVTGKDSSGKGQGTSRQNVGRNGANLNDKSTKSGKQSGSSGSASSSSTSSSMSLKNNSNNGQGTTSTSTDRKSPGAISVSTAAGAVAMGASASPKTPQTGSSISGTNSKTSTPAPVESDDEDDVPKGSDASSAPKVPPLKIVIPQSTTSEQELGARNGKNTSNRNHQLPYVVPSSNSGSGSSSSNDSADKDQPLSASGTTSPTETSNASKNDEKKDFSGVLHGEERSTHHQRVLRSSHRSGNGANGSSLSAKDGSVGGGSLNSSFANSSPIPTASAAPVIANSSTATMDRSNNSSPQQQLQQQPLLVQQQQTATHSQQQQQQQQSQQQPQQQQQQQTQTHQQQRHNSPGPETASNAESSKANASESAAGNNVSGNNGAARSGSPSNNSGGGIASKSGTGEKTDKNADSNNKSPKDSSESTEPACSSSSMSTMSGTNNSNNSSSSSSSSGSNNNNSNNNSNSNNNTITSNASVELHPRKRKMKPNKEAQQAAATAASVTNETIETTNTGPEVHPHDQPITNCYQLFLNIRKQIERRRKGLFPVQPKPPQGFKDYLMNRCTYVLAGNANKEPNINPPSTLQAPPMKDLYGEQEKERYRLRMQHVVEKEKLVLSVEQEILRVHGRAARALANQSLPFSVCTILKDEEVYNVITPEQEEKDRNARSRYNGRLFLSWLQDVDDKWEKIKEAMLLRHHNEAESLHAVQRMDWEWKLKEVGLCEFKVTPQIEDLHVPMVHVSDDFDLLPA